MVRSIALLLFSFFAGFTAVAQPDQFRFKRLDIDQGLSNNYVTCFLKDSRGFMWFGTISGLNRYDGSTIQVFMHDVSDTSSLINSTISKLFEGPDGKIWITTPQGINLYDPVTEKIIRDPGPMLRRFSIPAGPVEDIFQDTDTTHWFVHATQGLYRYHPGNGSTAHIKHIPGDTTSLCDNVVAAITAAGQDHFWVIHKNGVLEKLNASTRTVVLRNTYLRRINDQQPLPYSMTPDTDGDLWLYAEQDNRGVYYYNAAANTFTHLQKDSGKISLNTNIIRGIAQDNKGLIWIGTDHGGINLVNKKDWRIHYLLHDAGDEKSLGQNTVNAVYCDDQGVVWTGTYKDGISYYHEDLFRFPLYKENRSDRSSLPFNDINRFAEDDRGNLWLATNGGGLVYFNRQQNTFRRFVHEPGNPNSLSNNVIVSLYYDRREKKLWIGTYYGGLVCYDGKNFTTYYHDPADPNSLSHDGIWEIYEDPEGNLWIGTLDGGLERFDRAKKIFHHYPGDSANSIHSNYVSELKQDHEGNLWIGTAYGLEVMAAGTGAITHYLNDPADPQSISNNVIHAVMQDSRGLLWIGTAAGLNVFDYASRSFRVFRKENGLPHNTILSIVEDDSGKLWMGTPNGLSQATVKNPAGIRDLSVRFMNYDESDGLQGREFNENAAFKTSRGELIFGGAKGFNLFHPGQINVNTHTPQVVISDLELFNRRVNVGAEINGRVILSSAITQTQEITLRHRDNVIALQFAALNYLHPEKNQYRYTLEGFDHEWITTRGETRKAVYTNLDPGQYTFKVKASNNDGVWNEYGATLKITILPPFWKTNIAFGIYIALILLALLAARRIMLYRERARVQVQQERQEARRMHELDVMKIRFFTNVSHEFRTPLTLILTPMERLLKTTADTAQQKQFQLIHRNARRLLNLVNQLLDFRKLETQGIKYIPSEGDIVQFIRDATYSFSDLSEKKDIKLSFHSSLQKLETLFDQDKLEKILFNLLSNAFKFTPEHGQVSVDVTRPAAAEMPDERPWIRIQVKDTGIGIPKEKHEKIFERFFQHDLPASLVNQGSGIGLAITKEFVKIQGGSIGVTSEPEKGTCFTILLPVQNIRDAGPAPAPAREEIQPQEVTVPETVESGDTPDEKKGGEKKPILLLIEDNEDFRFYLKDNLKTQYAILEASNGREGWEQATGHIPDLIVSDIMMPEMNGIDLCRKLKNDTRTSHIPVILLTARTSEEQKMEGYETGATDYVVKPFSFEILQARIRNILRQQETLRDATRRKLAVKGSRIEVTPLDEQLIRKAVALVEKNMEDPDFSVEAFSQELGMSRIHLYRKLHGLTGKAPIEFIRTIRLQRAAQLLEKSQLNVSEIAYQVGFNNPKYFTKYFKEEFKMLPSAYAAARRKG